QITKLGQSVSFKEIERGEEKLILLKNGNTFFLHHNLKGELQGRLYGKDYKEIGIEKTEVENDKRVTLLGCFELNGDVAVFTEGYVGKTPTLMTYSFDGNTGKMKDKKTIATQPDVGLYGKN